MFHLGIHSCILVTVLFFCRGMVAGADDDEDEPEHLDYDWDCLLARETERIQIAFVVDNTGSNKKFVESLGKALVEMMDKINEIHDETEFALTLHSNWQQSVFRAGHELPEGCYYRESNFTTNSTAVAEIAHNVKKILGPEQTTEENGVAAIAFTASDKKLGWIEEDIDQHNRHVHRIIVFITDQWSIFELPKPGKRTPFRGDGSDSCTTSLPPSLSKLREILDRTNTYVIGVYLTSKCYAIHKAEFKGAGFGHRHYAKDFSKVKNKEKEFLKTLSEYVVDRVKRFLRCVWEEPIPFNTLGL